LRTSHGSGAESADRRAAATAIRALAHIGTLVARAASAMLSFKRVMIPVDFSDHSRRMLESCTKWFSGADGQSFHLVYVWQEPAFGYEGDPFEELRSKLAEFAKVFAPEGNYDTELTVLSGHPPTSICDYARKHDCDLIAIATHGRTGLDHLLIGSTAENVVRSAPCHVLTVRLAAD
jgi:nucleotide-binding universal stress UspA family protein